MTVDSRTDIHSILKTSFGYSTFRPLQQEIIETLLSGQDVFALMPTGGGKSLCYQLPAIAMPGTAVVISPLIALMKDQVDALQALGVAATFINSSVDRAEAERRAYEVRSGRMKLLYVAPERAVLREFKQLMRDIQPSLIAIDEAHCISEWGHDFRPEYRQLAGLRKEFPHVPVAAFTATATERVEKDIIAQLEMERASVFRASFNRQNLYYDVRPKNDAYGRLLAYLRRHPNASGIVYRNSRAGTEEVAVRLEADGVKAVAYHAGLTPDQRRIRQEAFVRDKVQVIVATIAFGMGIDKPDVRFVIHYDLPKTIENLYQESGRAGRDGDPADCILFYSTGDVVRARRFADEKPAGAERNAFLAQLGAMADWAESATCRRTQLMAYFGEVFEPQQDRCCDVCDGPPVELEDVTTSMKKFLSCVKRTGERFGATHVIEVLLGKDNERIRRLRHDQLSTYGIGREHSIEYWRGVAKEAVKQALVRQMGDEYPTLALAPLAQEVLFGSRDVRARVETRRQVSRRTSVDIANQPNAELFEQLRTLRTRVAAERTLPPHFIFRETALRHMAASLPASLQAMQQISGVGENKAHDFGQRFLDVITEYRERTGARPSDLPESPEAVAERAAQPNAALYQLLRELRTQMASERDVAPYVIFGDSVLRHMAASLPNGMGALSQIPGIGARKVYDFGPAFLEVIAQYSARTGVAPQSLPQSLHAASTKPTAVNGSAVASFRMFQSGKPIAEIAEERGLAVSTITSHVAFAIESSVEGVDADSLVPHERRRRIELAIQAVGDSSLAEIRNELGEEYDYGEISFTRALLRREARIGTGN